MAQSRTPDTPDDPYPPSCDFRITDFRYVDHLQLVRYGARPENSAPRSDWQLAEDYAVEIDIDYRDSNGETKRETWTIVAPQGLYTDLSTIPAFGRWIVSKVGPHLEASIIHDYLYLKWTDARLGSPRFCDWVFADEVLRAGMTQLSDFSRFQRFVVNFAVGTVGWVFFRRKKEPLAILIKRWKPNLDYRPHTPVPPDKQAPPATLPPWTMLYLTVSFLVFVAIALMGVDKLFDWFGWTEWGDGIADIVHLAKLYFVGLTSLVGALLALGLALYFMIRLYIGFRKSGS